MIERVRASRHRLRPQCVRLPRRRHFTRHDAVEILFHADFIDHRHAVMPRRPNQFQRATIFVAVHRDQREPFRSDIHRFADFFTVERNGFRAYADAQGVAFAECFPFLRAVIHRVRAIDAHFR